MSTDFIKRRKKLGGKGPKVKPRGGEKKLQISKNKATFSKIKENKPDGRVKVEDFIRQLNKRKGVELSTGLGSGALSGLARAITKKLD
jgi:hypothetical protein